jgi:hypothetical protein
MWSGTIASIPSGWFLCNGSNGTPDLRNRFVIGASVDSGGQSVTTITGGNTKTGGSKDAIVVSHSHDIAVAFAGDVGGSNNILYDAKVSSGNLQTQTVGSSGTNANLPPYFALAYIMKA